MLPPRASCPGADALVFLWHPLATVREAVICEPLRTAVGGFGGVLRDVPPAALAATVIEELMRRTSLPVGEVDEVLLGQCYPNGEAPAIGRVAALDAGLPIGCRGYRWTAVAALAFRPSWSAPCRCRRVSPIWCSREAPRA